MLARPVIKLNGLYDKCFERNAVWIELIYSTQITTILLDGFNSSKIQLRKGVRQECLLSPLLFIEVMTITVRNQAMIKVFSVPGAEHKLSLYTDVVFFLRDPINSLIVLQDLWQAYGAISGYKVIK